MHSQPVTDKLQLTEVSTFYVGDALYGMDILKIQEINKQMEMTSVPQSPDYVKGILNLRGRIVTIIDLSKKLGLTATGSSEDARNIIIKSQNEQIGLLVDRLGDVVQASWDSVEPPPASLNELQGKFFQGVYKTGNTLVGILDMEEVLREESE